MGGSACSVRSVSRAAVSGQSLNVLVVTENPTGTALRRPVRFWGSDGGPWRELLREERVLPPHSQPHR